MRVFLAGGTGTIGKALTLRLLGRGDTPVLLVRDAAGFRPDPTLPAPGLIRGHATEPGDWQRAVDGCDGVVNLVGKNLFGSRWTAKVKQELISSRVDSARQMVAAIGAASHRPRVLVQGSAIGYYGPRGDEPLTESAAPGDDFMATLCRDWEAAAEPAAGLGTRVVLLRTGIVLTPGAGALAAMTPVYRWLPGGAAPIGGATNPLRPSDGRQWFSWIDLEDIVGLILLALDNPAAAGPLNGVAPQPVRHRDFGKALAGVLHRPFLPIGPPAGLVRLMLGEVADAVTHGQRVLPTRAEALHFRFAYPEVGAALRHAFRVAEPAAG